MAKWELIENEGWRYTSDAGRVYELESLDSYGLRDRRTSGAVACFEYIDDPIVDPEDLDEDSVKTWRGNFVAWCFDAGVDETLDFMTGCIAEYEQNKED